jgi:hypothetical protein
MNCKRKYCTQKMTPRPEDEAKATTHDYKGENMTEGAKSVKG